MTFHRRAPLCRAPLCRALVGLAVLGALAAPGALRAQTAADIPPPMPVLPPAAPVATSATGMAVERPWARAALQGGSGGAFLTLRNAGTQPDRLLSASTPLARATEIHETAKEGDVMRMRPIAAIEVPVGTSVALRPGSVHVMMMGLSEALKPGATLPLTLTFERAGTLEIQVPVQSAGASGPGGAARHNH